MQSYQRLPNNYYGSGLGAVTSNKVFTGCGVTSDNGVTQYMDPSYLHSMLDGKEWYPTQPDPEEVLVDISKKNPNNIGVLNRLISQQKAILVRQNACFDLHYSAKSIIDVVVTDKVQKIVALLDASYSWLSGSPFLFKSVREEYKKGLPEKKEPPPPVVTCPDGTMKNYPACLSPYPPPVETCPDGTTNNYPACLFCPPGTQGDYPLCTPIKVAPPEPKKETPTAKASAGSNNDALIIGAVIVVATGLGLWAYSSTRSKSTGSLTGGRLTKNGRL